MDTCILRRLQAQAISVLPLFLGCRGAEDCYCSVEKVGSTSLKMFLRSLRGLPTSPTTSSRTTAAKGGLHCLFPSFKGATEADGIRQVSQ